MGTLSAALPGVLRAGFAQAQSLPYIEFSGTFRLGILTDDVSGSDDINYGRRDFDAAADFGNGGFARLDVAQIDSGSNAGVASIEVAIES